MSVLLIICFYKLWVMTWNLFFFKDVQAEMCWVLVQHSTAGARYLPLLNNFILIIRTIYWNIFEQNFIEQFIYLKLLKICISLKRVRTQNSQKFHFIPKKSFCSALAIYSRSRFARAAIQLWLTSLISPMFSVWSLCGF